MRDNSIERIIISGATSVIGAELVKQLSGRNAELILLARDKEKLNNIIEKSSNTCVVDTLIGDLSSRKFWTDLELDRYRKINAFINCVGTLSAGSLMEQSLESIDEVISTNLTGHFYALKKVLPKMIRQGEGHVIELGSLGGIVPMPYASPYSASKFGLRGLVLSIREELRNTGVKISLVSLGPVDTRMLLQEALHPDVTIPFATKILSPEKAARRIIRLMDKPAAEIILPRRDKLSAILLGPNPGIFGRIYPLINKLGLAGRKRYLKKYEEFRDT